MIKKKDCIILGIFIFLLLVEYWHPSKGLHLKNNHFNNLHVCVFCDHADIRISHGTRIIIMAFFVTGSFKQLLIYHY